MTLDIYDLLPFAKRHASHAHVRAKSLSVGDRRFEVSWFPWIPDSSVEIIFFDLWLARGLLNSAIAKQVLRVESRGDSTGRTTLDSWRPHHEP